MLTIPRLAHAVAVSCLLMSAGCQTAYIPPAGEKMVTARLDGASEGMQMCTANGRYNLNIKEEKGVFTIQIPVGQRVTLINSMFGGSYPYRWACYAKLSLTAEEGKDIMLISGSNVKGCYIQAMRLNRARATGVPDPTAGPPSC